MLRGTPSPLPPPSRIPFSLLHLPRCPVLPHSSLSPPSRLPSPTSSILLLLLVLLPLPSVPSVPRLSLCPIIPSSSFPVLPHLPPSVRPVRHASSSLSHPPFLPSLSLPPSSSRIVVGESDVLRISDLGRRVSGARCIVANSASDSDAKTESGCRAIGVGSGFGGDMWERMMVCGAQSGREGRLCKPIARPLPPLPPLCPAFLPAFSGDGKDGGSTGTQGPPRFLLAESAGVASPGRKGSTEELEADGRDAKEGKEKRGVDVSFPFFGGAAAQTNAFPDGGASLLAPSHIILQPASPAREPY
ncbi:hypothetical protein B0H11DRAFT_2239383 [Mycena galericulata]|nr:hypothetical protein B0H11DRAFT_2239383 [Mycena galericulata]